MSADFCPRENEVVEATRLGLWNQELGAHVSGCSSCQEARHVSSLMAGLAERLQSAPPHPMLVWLRAQLEAEQRRQEREIRRAAIRRACWQVAAFLAALGVLRVWPLMTEAGFGSYVSVLLEPMLSLGPEVYWPSLAILVAFPVFGFFLVRRYRGGTLV